MYKGKKQNWYVNPKKYHFIYKTTCKLNGKFYYGMHSTDVLGDGYIGSGTRLWHAIRKYGRENFSIEILEFLATRESLKKRESELITEEMLKDPMCMNLTLGGHGGSHCGRIGGRVFGEKYGKDWNKKFGNNALGGKISGRMNQPKTQTPEARAKRIETMSKNQHQLGAKNSQFGMMWITNGAVSRKVSRDHQLEDGWKRGRVMT